MNNNKDNNNQFTGVLCIRKSVMSDRIGRMLILSGFYEYRPKKKLKKFLTE